MPSLLRNLINAGEISDRCLRCHARLESRDCAAGRRVLGELKAQDVHKSPEYQYQLALYALAKCSFYHSCASTPKAADYLQDLTRCLGDECGAAKEAPHVSGSGAAKKATPVPGPEEAKTESQKRKDRRTCAPAELTELAKQMKQLERDSDGFKKRISVLKQELLTERSQREQLQRKHQKLQLQHNEVIDVGTKQLAELTQRNADLLAQGTTIIADLNKQNANLTVEANTRFAELMQKIAGLESQNSWIQEQMQTQQTRDKIDIAKMASTIKELNAALRYCHGERYKIWLTPTSQHVVNTLEPM